MPCEGNERGEDICVAPCYNACMEFDVETIIETLGYLGIFLLMTANGLISFPSSQFLYILTGYFISTGNLLLVPVVLFGALGNALGNVLLYELVRTKGLHYVEKWNLFPKRELRKISVAFHKKGVWFLFVGKLLPALKVFVPIGAALGKTHRGVYVVLMFVASAIWALPFNAIGYYVGKSTDTLGTYAVFIMILAFVVMALFYRYLNSKEVLDAVRE